MRYVIRERFFRLGEDSDITDEAGRPVYNVDGKVWTLRDTLIVRDPAGTDVAKVEHQLIALAPTYHITNEDGANRAPYGQGYLEGSQNTVITGEAYAALRDGNQRAARARIDAVLRGYGVDVVMTEASQLYAPAGYPALTVPLDYTEEGQPEGQVFVGGYLSEPQLLAVGYAYEQATRVFTPPDLARTISSFDALASPAP